MIVGMIRVFSIMLLRFLMGGRKNIIDIYIFIEFCLEILDILIYYIINGMKLELFK